MKPLRLLPLLALPLLFLGATCVTRVEQKGPTGPWVGEVTNNGPDPVSYIYPEAQVFDASGRFLGRFGAGDTCPRSLLPGETGVFRMDAWFGYDQAAVPLRAQFDPIARAEPGVVWGEEREGLTARLIQKDIHRGYALAEITNSSLRTYHDLAICAVLRAPDGLPADIGSASPLPSILRPGQKVRTVIFFDNMTDGYLDFFPSGSSSCGGLEVVLDPSLFDITAERFAQTPEGRELQVIGDLLNTSGQDLLDVNLEAYIEGDPSSVVQVPVGCDGIIAYGARGSAAFSLTLNSGYLPSVIIAGIEGSSGEDVFSVPISGIAVQKSGEDVIVSATLSNPGDRWLDLRAACFNLRGQDGTLVGAATVIPEDPSRALAQYLAPGASIATSVTVSPLARATSAEAVAYGSPSDGPPPAIEPPVNPGP